MSDWRAIEDAELDDVFVEARDRDVMRLLMTIRRPPAEADPAFRAALGVRLMEEARRQRDPLPWSARLGPAPMRWLSALVRAATLAWLAGLAGLSSSAPLVSRAWLASRARLATLVRLAHATPVPAQLARAVPAIRLGVLARLGPPSMVRLGAVAVMACLAIAAVLVSRGDQAVTVRSPLDHSHTVSVVNPITLTFTQPMDQRSTEQAVQIEPATAVTYRWTSRTTLEIVPRQGTFAPDTYYQVTVRSSARTVDQRTLSQQVQISFVTVGDTPTPSASPSPTSSPSPTPSPSPSPTPSPSPSPSARPSPSPSPSAAPSPSPATSPSPPPGGGAAAG